MDIYTLIVLGGLFLVACFAFANPTKGAMITPEKAPWGVLEMLGLLFLLAIVGFFLAAAMGH